MAKDLAKKGFNILIVGRNQKKIEARIADIKVEIINKEFEIDYIIADFGKLDKISDYKAIIADQIKSRGYDVGVVCLNAGTFANLAPFGDIPDQAVQDMCNINVSHVIYCIKTLLPLMTNRK